MSSTLPAPPQRRCLAFVAAEGAEQCNEPATCVCTAAGGFQWYACEKHGQVGAEHSGAIVQRVTSIEDWWNSLQTKGEP